MAEMFTTAADREALRVFLTVAGWCLAMFAVGGAGVILIVGGA